ncbi:odorant receptor Or1-like [Pogonomyrmex barbatus]|uniref:Odorant receptor n=1 Tax=Pogonomyrmex barbatus TaxID=144034 RepID=A0A6I9WH22_9HYME|nr:odorant receptor Or1-like [Pogonomyrmex barbatus]
MRVLGLTLKILTSCGCWIPNSWTSPYKRAMYYAYTTFIFLLINTFTLSQFLDLILIVDNADDFIDNFYILLAMIISCSKMFSLLINRNNIVLLTEILTKNPCKPVEDDELEIRQKFDKIIEINTLHYAILVEFSCSYLAVQSFFTAYCEEKLTFRAWLPFDYSTTVLFHFTYFHQLIALFVGAFLHVACDSIICGLLLHICCQIEILNSRLKRIIQTPKILRDCVIQHNLLISFAWLVNEKFRMTIVIQFIVSTLVVCFNLYQFTKSITKYMQLIMYMGCMLSQIFFYCWYGNEVKLKSRQLVDSIFEMEWFELNKYTKQSLLMIMKRSSRPIELTSAYVISMNLDSFVSILKTSYSAYNILKQM